MYLERKNPLFPRQFTFILGLCCLFSCSENMVENTGNQSVEVQPDSIVNVIEDLEENKQDTLYLKTVVVDDHLVDVQSLNPSILIELKYATMDNFMKMKVYDRIAKAYLQKDVAERLARCQDHLSTIDPSLHLLIYDAIRPVSVQRKMWKALDSLPPKERGKYVSNPANRSVHNYGAAVDLTICNQLGEPLDMGAEFDQFDEIAYPSKELFFLANGQLTIKQVENRKLLRKVMKIEGFTNIPSEWWHFNACSRTVASQKYKALEEEP